MNSEFNKSPQVKEGAQVDKNAQAKVWEKPTFEKLSSAELVRGSAGTVDGADS